MNVRFSRYSKGFVDGFFRIVESERYLVDAPCIEPWLNQFQASEQVVHYRRYPTMHRLHLTNWRRRSRYSAASPATASVRSHWWRSASWPSEWSNDAARKPLHSSAWTLRYTSRVIFQLVLAELTPRWIFRKKRGVLADAAVRWLVVARLSARQGSSFYSIRAVAPFQEAVLGLKLRSRIASEPSSGPNGVSDDRL